MNNETPINKAFFCLDITDFTLDSSEIQLNKINHLIRILKSADFKMRCKNNYAQIKDPEEMLCIGDGYIFIFDDCISALWFAATLCSCIEYDELATAASERIYFRGGVHFGEVYGFCDPGRQGPNYVGDGINGATRIYEVIGKDIDNVIFISQETKEKLLEANANENDVYAKELIQCLSNRGRRVDKHNEVWRVYELDHIKADDRSGSKYE